MGTDRLEPFFFHRCHDNVYGITMGYDTCYIPKQVISIRGVLRVIRFNYGSLAFSTGEVGP